MCFPAKTSNCSVIAACVQTPSGMEELLRSRRIRKQIRFDGRIRDALNQAGAVRGGGDAEDDIVQVGKVRLSNGTTDRAVRTPGDCKQVVNASVRCSIRVSDESHLPNWTVDCKKWWNRVVRRHTGCVQNLRIVCRGTGPSNCRIGVASGAGIQIEPGSQTFAHAFHLT